MRNIYLFCVLLLSLVVGCGSSLHTPVRSPDSLHQHLGNVTVALVYQGVDDDGNKFVKPYCTGVWLSDDQILTAGHCAEAVARMDKKLDEDDPVDPVGNPVHYIVSVEVPDAKEEEPSAVHFGHVTSFDEDHDLALITASAGNIPEHDNASLASEIPALGERVYVVGHPRGLYWSYIEGVVSAYRNHPEVGMTVQVSAPVWFGNSGGGVFDSHGGLVGIASRLARAPNTALFIHEDSIKKFLNTVKERQERHDAFKQLQESEQKK